MRLLLDTHIFLWMASDDKRLNAKARQILLAANSIAVSSATIWEIAIKSRLGKIKIDPQDAIREMEECAMEELPVSCKHAAAVALLPPIHEDPFDRMLIAQAQAERLHLLTADRQLVPYSDLVLLV